MDEYIKKLVEGINLWRSKEIEEYWIQAEYLGGDINRVGDHTFTVADGKLHHLWKGKWREIETGKDYWLFSVPGTFAWARDMLTKILPEAEAGPEAITLRFNDEYGYVEHMDVKVAKRDATNVSYEVKVFGEGRHPDFEG